MCDALSIGMNFHAQNFDRRKLRYQGTNWHKNLKADHSNEEKTSYPLTF